MSIAESPLLSRLGLQEAAGSKAGTGIQVAVLDGGIAPLPAFAHRLTRLHPDGSNDRGPASSHATRCATLIASADDRAMGLAPKCRLISINVSTNAAVDVSKVKDALQWLQAHPVDVISASFVLPEPDQQLMTATRSLVEQGTSIIGAAANSPDRQQYPWIRDVAGAIRVFSGHIPDTAMPTSAAAVVTAPSRNLRVFDSTGALITKWRGQSSGATAVVAGLTARWRGDGTPPNAISSHLVQRLGRPAGRNG